MAWFSPVLYAPFYLVAIYAVTHSREWIRAPALMWAWGLLLTMVVIGRDAMYGPTPTTDPLTFWSGAFML
jgi:hypothetical protein